LSPNACQISRTVVWLIPCLAARLRVAAPVNLREAQTSGNHCSVTRTSFGSLIHATVGSAGGSGSLRTNRSGWAT
jgi:hypothetical protein